MPLRQLRPHLLIVCVAMLLATSGCVHHALPAIIVTGELRGDLVWSGEVLVGGDVTLATGSRLVIQPGTVVRFLPPDDFPGNASDHPHFPGSELNVEGELIALGTATAPIVFAAAGDQSPAGSWGALNFAENSSGRLRFCVFRQADSAIHSREAAVEVSDSLFENNLVGIRFNTSKMLIERNLLRANGVGIRFHFGAPVVRSNRFEANRVNLFITAHPRDYRFETNLFGRPHEYDVVLGEEVPENVQLPGNYWEGLMTGTDDVRFFDGCRASYLGRVQIEPPLADLPVKAGPSWTR